MDTPKPRVVDTTDQSPDPLGYRGVPNIDGKPAESIVEPTPVAEKDYGSYKCRGGRLIITSTGVRFDSSLGRTDHWHLRYQNVRKLEKVCPVIRRARTEYGMVARLTCHR
jgi:hypothetical protein